MSDNWGDNPKVRAAFGYRLRAGVTYQDGEYSEAPLLVFADADYEVGDGACGLHEDGKRANEPAIVYVRADAFLAQTDEIERLRKQLREQALTTLANEGQKYDNR